MTFKAWEFKLGDKIISVTAQKETAQAIIHRFERLNRIRQHVKEVSGIIGGETYTSSYYILFGTFGLPVRDEEKFKIAVAALIAKMPNTLNPVTAVSYIKEADEIFDAHIPVKDIRKTPEAIAESNKKGEEFKAELQAKRETWQKLWCGPEKVVVPEGEMAVYLSMCYDNSDFMTDYFDPHAKIGEDMLLGTVCKGSQTERIARGILNEYPDLAKLEWTWHTENYSMGHGNYLMSAWTDHKESHHGYDGRDEVVTRWEIRFWSYKKEFFTYKDYPGTDLLPPQTDPLFLPGTTLASTGATVTHNEAHNGIEVKFPSKPDESVISSLKSREFRWSRGQGLWYKKYTDADMDEVKKILNIS